MSWETWAPESEKVTTVRGCLISSSACSWFSLAIGWRKKRSMSVSSARSIIASTGSHAALARDLGHRPVRRRRTLSMTKIQS